jgi:DNA (cytosine-5)-methyltransferase 1
VASSVLDIPTIDLFAGAGGLGLGAAEAGADLRLSIDNDTPSCETLEANAGPGHTIMEADVGEMTGADLRSEAGLSDSDPLLVVGGAPCQPFSKAAYWLEEGHEARYRRSRAAGKRARRPTPPTRPRPDRRRTLVEEYWRLVEESRADAFVFENVRSITHPRNRPVLEGLEQAAANAGFQTTRVLVNAVQYGVPQRRQRVFLLGSKTHQPVTPDPTHGDPDKNPELAPWETAGPALRPFRAKRFHEPDEVVAGKWAEHLETVPPGRNYKAHTAWGGHPNPTFVTETRFWNFLLKLSPDLPSWTVNANPGPWTGPFHWESRRLRIPELAALQTFPEGYEFCGTRREKVRQIGNAVPPRLGSAMVSAALASFEEQPESVGVAVVA